MQNEQTDQKCLTLYHFQMEISANHTLGSVEIAQTEGTRDNQIFIDPTQAGSACIGILQAAEEIIGEASGSAALHEFRTSTLLQLADALGCRSQVEDLVKAMITHDPTPAAQNHTSPGSRPTDPSPKQKRKR